MEFKEALDIIQNTVEGLKNNEYDGIIVKRLEASNTLDDRRSTNQTHIAITGVQMNMFPYLMADGYFQRNYDEKDEQLKKYFITQIPLILYKENIEYLSLNGNNDIDFGDENNICVRASIVRSRRKAQSDQVQLSLTTMDDRSFVSFRKLLHTGDYLVILKQKEKLQYDCIGVRGSDETGGDNNLCALNNKFYKLSTNTKIDIKNLIEIKDVKVKRKEFSMNELGEILHEMYNNADDKMKVASIYIFGIKYGKNIIDNEFGAMNIIKVAGLNESYSSELQKALNVYRCLERKTYGICLSGGNEGEMDDITSIKRKTGAENILLYGVPGAGKSHKIKTDYCSDEKFMERVIFHPDYTYSDFVGQILPRVKKTEAGDKLEYTFISGPFTRMLKKAERDPANYYYLIIEELNRGNAPAIFGEIFQLLDRKEEKEYPMEELGESEYGISNYDVAREVYNDEMHQVKIPSNMYVLATMNTADQNIFTLDTAFQRRWYMRQVENQFDLSKHSKNIIIGTEVNWGAFATVINDLVVEINVNMASSEDKRLGIYFAKVKELEEKRFPEKVLKYLWDDAFKMDKQSVFKDEFKSLEEVINKYENAISDKLSAVLRSDVYNKMITKMHGEVTSNSRE